MPLPSPAASFDQCHSKRSIFSRNLRSSRTVYVLMFIVPSCSIGFEQTMMTMDDYGNFDVMINQWMGCYSKFSDQAAYHVVAHGSLCYVSLSVVMYPITLPLNHMKSPCFISPSLLVQSARASNVLSRARCQLGPCQKAWAMATTYR